MDMAPEPSTPLVDELTELEMIRETVREIADGYDDRFWIDVADGKEAMECC